MASRTDQLHSHQFTVQRVVAALAQGDPNPVSSPTRRVGGALFIGAMATALVVAAVAVYGMLRPGEGSSWREGGSVIVERETGARFVYRDGALHPVVNYTSDRRITLRHPLILDGLSASASRPMALRFGEQVLARSI